MCTRINNFIKKSKVDNKMKNLELATDEELERLRRQGRLVGPINSVTVEQMQKLLGALTKNKQYPPHEKAQAPEAQAPMVKKEPSNQKYIFGQGFVPTDKGPARAIQMYKVLPEK